MSLPKKPVGVYVEHRYRKTNWLYAVPILKIPRVGPGGLPNARICNLCQIAHPCKVIHLDLVEGRAIVSQGVLKTLRLANLPNLDIVGTTKTPPPLAVGGDAGRVEQNQNNRKITQWKNYKPKKGVVADAAT